MPTERERREVAARRDRVLSMRAAGMTYQQICDNEPTLSTASAAVQDAQRALKLRAHERDVEADALSLELERLGSMERAAQTVMRTAATQGSQRMVLDAIDRLVQISRRRDALLGLSMRAQSHDGEPDSGQGFDEVAAQRRKRRAGKGW
jgi:hypothetical protein